MSSWMSRSSCGVVAFGLSFMVWGCSPPADGDGANNGSSAQCEGGKCDSATSTLPTLTPLTDLSLGTCALTGRAEEIVVECAVSPLPDVTQMQHALTVVRVEDTSNFFFNDTATLREAAWISSSLDTSTPMNATSSRASPRSSPAAAAQSPCSSMASADTTSRSTSTLSQGRS